MSNFIFVINDLDFLISHRGNLVEELIKKHFSINIIYEKGTQNSVKYFVQRKIKITKIEKSFFFLNFLYYFYRLFLILRKNRPEYVCLITLKPVIFGGIACKFSNIKRVISILSGLGYLFTNPRNKPIQVFIRQLLKASFSNSSQRIILQNHDDLDLILQVSPRSKNNIRLMLGSGVDLKVFKPKKENKELIVLMVSRILKDKGVIEFIDSARLVRKNNPKIKFIIAGDFYEKNPTSISRKELNKINFDNIIEHVGYVKDIYSLYCNSSVVVLPSYREGFPKTLIEAAACGKPIVTTNVPGCKEAIIPNITGFLVEPRNARELADAIIKLLENDDLRKSMGIEGRKLAEKNFSIVDTTNEYIKIISEMN